VLGDGCLVLGGGSVVLEPLDQVVGVVEDL